MFLSTNSCSMVPLFGLNPACSSLSIQSTVSLIRMIMVLPSIFAGIDINVKPLQFPHFVRSPFFGSFTIEPSHGLLV